MGKLTLGFGAVLVLIGTVTYFATGGASIIALIPAFIGATILVAGFLMTRPGTYFLRLYLAIALALLTALGALRGVAALFGGDLSTTTVINVALLLISAGYLVVAAREMFAGRRDGSRPSGA